MISSSNFNLDSIPHIAWISGGETLHALTDTPLQEPSRFMKMRIRLNDEWTHYTGLSSELSVESILSECVHPLDLPQAQELFQSSTKEIEKREFTLRLKRSDGTYRWHLVRTKGRFTTATDVHERIGSEYALKRMLRHSQDQLSMALQSAKIGTWEIDLKSGLAMSSREMLEIWEIENPGGPLKREILQSRVHPSDLEVMRKAIEFAIQERGVYDFEYRLVFEDGRTKWVHARGHCFFEEDSDQPDKLIGVVFDITAEKKIQEERFRLIVENVKDYAIFMLDPQGKVATWNEGARRIKGYEPNEIIGHHFSRFYLEAEREHKPERLLHEAAARGSVEDEGWRLRKDGSRFWANVLISALRNSEGRLVGFSKITRDLTERRRAETQRLEDQKRQSLMEQLKQSEKTLDQIFQESPSFMALIRGPDHVFERANRKYYDFVGRDESILGKPVRDVFPEIQEQGFIAILDGVYRSGERWVGTEVSIRLKSKQGPAAQIFADLIYQPMRNTHGEVYAIVAQGFDVTEKVLARQAIERSKATIEIERENFRNLFKQTPEMVCILHGPEHLFEFVNEAHVRVLGFDATGMKVREAQPESVEVHGLLDQVYQTGNTAELFEIPVTVTDRLRYFNLTYAARRDEAGQINGVMILGTEVTEQVRSREELKRAVEARDTFMSIASHELKTPLSSLKLQVQMQKRALQRGDLTRFAPERLPQIFDAEERQVNRIIRLVDDMLDVSRIQTGKLTLSGESFDFSEMVRDTLERLSPQLESQGCQVSLKAQQEIQGVWDRFRIEQVLINLLSNASKYGAGKPVEVELSADEGFVALTVKDHGMGIAAQDQDRIFGQFERAVSENSISGLGLGLFISKKIIEAHHGSIHVESVLGEGSTFTVRLPRMSMELNEEVPLV